MPEAEQRRASAAPRATWAWGAVVLVGLGWAIALVGNGQVGMDEANTLATAWRVAQGDRLYQEAWEFIAPWPFQAMALLFGLTGPSLDVARAVAAGWALATVALAFALARRLGAGPWWACLASAGVAWGSSAWGWHWYHHGWSQPLLLLALLLLHQATQRAHLAWWAAAGGAASAAGLCTQSLSLVGLPALALGWGLWAQGVPRAQAGRAGAALLLGAVAPWLGTTLAFACTGGAGAFWTQVWWWPATHYRLPASGNEVWPFSDVGARLFPFGREAMSYPAWLARVAAWVGFAALPFVAAVGSAFGALGWAWRGGQGGGPALGPGAFRWALGLAAILQLAVTLRGRADLAHLQMGSALACVLASAWASSAWQAARATPSPEAWGALRGLGLMWLALVLSAGASSAWQLRQLAREGLWAPGRLDALQREAPALRALSQHLQPGERMFAFASWGVAYLLTEVRPATRYTLFTRLADRYYDAGEYAAFRADWAASPPTWVALMDVSASQAVPQWGGAPSLAGYRLVHEGPYRLGAHVVPFSLWRREDRP